MMMLMFKDSRDDDDDENNDLPYDDDGDNNDDRLALVLMRLRLIMMGSVDVVFDVDHKVYNDLDHHWWFTRWWSSGLQSRALI